jgi:hypothetical protein
MSTRQTLQRIARLERLMCPQDDGDGTISVTLKQLCRGWWNDDKKGFKKMAEKDRYYQGFVRRFQAADNMVAAANDLQRIDAERIRCRLD